MAEEHAGRGTQENPLTREDVLKAVEENGGTARGLDLSGKWFEAGINLQNRPLEGINLQNALFRAHIEGSRSIGARFDGSSMLGANLRNARLEYASFGMYGSEPTAMQGVDLRGAHLENADFQGANLTGAQFRETEMAATTEPWEFLKPRESLPAYLDNTDFRYAVLTLAQFKGCYFYGTKLEGANIRGAAIYDAHLEQADWGNYVLGEETRKDELHFAGSIYRQLKQWYTSAGMYDVAGRFFFREMTVRRKALKWWPNPFPRLWSKFVSLICGYGEKPERVIVWAASVITGLALIYFLVGGVWEWAALWRSLYFSAVSFTALGYGSWMKATSEWMIGLGAFESFVGVFSMALFLVTFTRKMTR